MSYTTDVYRRIVPAEKNIFHLGLYIVWFPQMVAGPIERASSLLPQLKQISSPTMENVKTGISLFTLGLFKKLVIADNLASLVDTVYANPEAFPPFASLMATYAFAFQIYCDFSAYTDIAKGSSLFFGVRLSENFISPYLAKSLPEFWKRWHISLSSWFFEYVFFPIVRKYPFGAGPWVALFTVFTLSGFWHGANWTFLIWGLLHFVIYTFYLVLPRRFPDISVSSRFGQGGLIALNFHAVCLGWIFFRASSVSNASTVIERISSIFRAGISLQGVSEFVLVSLYKGGAGLVIFFLLALSGLLPLENRALDWKRVCFQSALCLIVTLLFGSREQSAFIYFQF